MNNEEKAQDIISVTNANQVYDVVDFDALHEALLEDLLEMAQWKDEQLEQTREDAKSLHDDISDCIDRLVKSRLSKNGIGESNALQQMESIMVKIQQFLQTI